ncbi:MAG: GNAT family N-acetyltransferase [Sedimenticola sp.]|uniref:GNAT family N-acetyltransferase n=1 Tax=Sedimenticola thiotaurini TaxID=1543721 RepID=A0A558D4A4_9GAMM|nr:GNAT family N-acetyltransferase [Sedimenticola sp.]MCW8974384.1 GNAT family N-acetyltransferase [Sedimenticola sp.]MCW9022647.1 GNAT family N-acetyltransferase [Sedimenticola sp.]MDF1530267.1 GNAT family N-acetyltransferase [Sedimenticola sp.]TVT55831.1 MAG: GNAT family N-acetyltransferase [Sedimenticola thiotaurini]
MLDIQQADLTLPSHAQAVVDLLDAYACDPMGGGQPLQECVRSGLIGELQKRNDVLILLAFVDGTPVGLMNCFEGFSTFKCKPLLNIHDVVVLKAYRGQGIAQKLFAAVEKIALQRGYCKLTLEVLEGNKVAQSVYRQVGFSDYELDPATGRALFWEKVLP